ncbi:hypothetical protein ACIBG8_42390 [Nonomuraea sp. NPDC050556]|uniref:hypothetical protein n=1 Tax=Nonomuraea sp. NPDC050556 TaxID=3364369 RepID=UPI003790F7FD
MIHQGGTAVLYAKGDQVLKVTRDPADNQLLKREAIALRTIAAEADPTLMPYIPRLIETLRVRGHRTNLISRAPDGFVTLERVGVRDPRDIAWIWRRLLVAVGVAHSTGISHGAVLPRHVLVHPIEHGLILVDWCRAGRDPSDDVLAVTRCVAALIDSPPVRMRTFVDGCLARPPRDAWALLKELDDLLEDLYGPRTYRPLHL